MNNKIAINTYQQLDVKQQFPLFLAPETGFVVDIFSTDGRGGAGGWRWSSGGNAREASLACLLLTFCSAPSS